MICNFSVHSAGISDNLLKNFSINCKLVITYSRRKISFTMKKKYSIASLILTAALVIVCSYIGVRLYNDHRQNSTSREVEADIARGSTVRTAAERTGARKLRRRILSLLNVLQSPKHKKNGLIS